MDPFSSKHNVIGKFDTFNITGAALFFQMMFASESFLVFNNLPTFVDGIFYFRNFLPVTCNMSQGIFHSQSKVMVLCAFTVTVVCLTLQN